MKKKIVFGLAVFLFAGITTISFATDTNPPVKEDFKTHFEGRKHLKDRYMECVFQCMDLSSESCAYTHNNPEQC